MQIMRDEVCWRWLEDNGAVALKLKSTFRVKHTLPRFRVQSHEKIEPGQAPSLNLNDASQDHRMTLMSFQLAISRSQRGFFGFSFESENPDC